MPQKNSNATKPDSILMTPDVVNDKIVRFLESKDFIIKKASSKSEVDVRAIKGKIELIIESRGNQAFKNTGTDIVFDGSQLDVQVSEQVTQIMRFQQTVSTNKFAIFVMANPNIERIRNRVNKIAKGLDKLGIIRLWINYLGEVEIEIEGTGILKEDLNFD